MNGVIRSLRHYGIGWMSLFFLLGMAAGVIAIEIYLGINIESVKQALTICTGASPVHMGDAPSWLTDNQREAAADILISLGFVVGFFFICWGVAKVVTRNENDQS